MPDKKPALDYREQLRRFAEQGNVEVLKQELKALKKERRYLPVCEPLVMELKQFIETAKERKKDIEHHKDSIELSIKNDQEERERIQRQQEEEEQIKKLHEARKKCLSLMEEMEEILTETRENRVQALLENEETSEYIDQLVDDINADRPEDDKVSREDVARELVLRGDEAIKKILPEKLDKKPSFSLDEAVPEAQQFIEENQDSLRRAWLPTPTPSSSPLSILSEKHYESDSGKKLMGVVLTTGMTVVMVSQDVFLAVQKQREVMQDITSKAQDVNDATVSAIPTPKPYREH